MIQNQEFIPVQEVKKKPSLMHAMGEDPMCSAVKPQENESYTAILSDFLQYYAQLYSASFTFQTPKASAAKLRAIKSNLGARISTFESL